MTAQLYDYCAYRAALKGNIADPDAEALAILRLTELRLSRLRLAVEAHETLSEICERIAIKADSKVVELVVRRD